MPRFNTMHHQGSFNPNPDRAKTLGLMGSLRLNSGIHKDVQKELAKRGRKIKITSKPLARIRHPIRPGYRIRGTQRQTNRTATVFRKNATLLT